jgi:hypothetical protein
VTEDFGRDIDPASVMQAERWQTPFAGKYIWWKTPDEAVAMPARLVAQVMNIGDYDDVQALAHQVGDQYLRDELADWHDRLLQAADGHPAGRAATPVALGRPLCAAGRPLGRMEPSLRFFTPRTVFRAS